MKIDHLVMNVDERYQQEEAVISSIRQAGLPYEPKWGKGTKGFKASNIWIGREYFELIHLLKQDGGGWMPEWVQMYNEGHRGPVCLMLDVEDIQQVFSAMAQKDVQMTKPEYLKFKWGLGLFTRTMPWMNSYFDFFQGVPLQLGLQQMKDQKSEEFMCQYMVPNARDNGITGIRAIHISGPFTQQDLELVDVIFSHVTSHDGGKTVSLHGGQQTLGFYPSDHFAVRVEAVCENDDYRGNQIELENVVVEMG